MSPKFFIRQQNCKTLKLLREKDTFKTKRQNNNERIQNIVPIKMRKWVVEIFIKTKFRFLTKPLNCNIQLCIHKMNDRLSFICLSR